MRGKPPELSYAISSSSEGSSYPAQAKPDQRPLNENERNNPPSFPRIMLGNSADVHNQCWNVHERPQLPKRTIRIAKEAPKQTAACSRDQRKPNRDQKYFGEFTQPVCSGWLFRCIHEWLNSCST
jgi:hypothetical protein